MGTIGRDRGRLPCALSTPPPDNMEGMEFTLLLVDDNDIVIRTLSRLLEEEGYRVLTAQDGRQALASIEREDVDLVVLDINMPDLDGVSVLRSVRQDYPPEELPVIMATANGHSEDIVQAFQMGANDYITKPLDLPVVLARIRSQLRSRRPVSSGPQPHPAAIGEIRIGSILQERYLLESRIGRGQFGVVYRATHLQLERPVAVKILRASLEGDPTSWQRFHQESVSTGRIQHPNAVTVLDFAISEEGVPFMVMELLEGTTLEKELRFKGVLSAERCAEIIIPVCAVLAAAHDLGIVHRDVKPQNIFLHYTRQLEVVKVLDFGLAKLIDESFGGHKMTHEGHPGTPAYMAPERYSEIPYDGRSDVYSVGVVLYEMLTGQAPFSVSDGNPMALALKHLSEQPRPPSTLHPGLAPEIDDIVMAAMTKDHEARPDARQLGIDLALAVGLEPSEALLPQSAEPPVWNPPEGMDLDSDGTEESRSSGSGEAA